MPSGEVFQDHFEDRNQREILHNANDARGSSWPPTVRKLPITLARSPILIFIVNGGPQTRNSFSLTLLSTTMNRQDSH